METTHENVKLNILLYELVQTSKVEENACESKAIHEGMVSYFDFETQELVRYC